MKKLTFLLVLMASQVGLIWAQPVLTLSEAIDTALVRNLTITVAEMGEEAAQRGVYRSAAGFGPQLSLNGNFNTTLNNVNQNFIDGRNLSRFGRAFAPNIALVLDWTLYDGGRMQAILDRLKVLGETASLDKRLAMQNVVMATMDAYYEVVFQASRVAYLETIIAYYEERLDITEERWQVGRGSKLDFLQARTDLNAQLAERSLAQGELLTAKIALNGVMNVPLDRDFQTTVPDRGQTVYDLDELKEQARLTNPVLLRGARMEALGRLAEVELAAARKPQVGFRGQAGYSYLNTNAGFLLSNQNAALTLGLSARWSIYDGQHLKRSEEIAHLLTEQATVQKNSTEQAVMTDLMIAFNRYESDREQLAFENENSALAEENLTISAEKFKLGASTILEVIEAQRSYDIALNRLVDAEHNLRLSELDLLVLSGSLIQ
ncbi:MAG: TolC family protein [Saprospiraceae bacterium]|nr:TolC family protein [Saprospiraceae bacterium]